ncbi:hypothetical protein PISMIDRAFT_92103 [Pisolithus microcarpus 441]|uniref:Letm1 RBD domain-containing protein n=1 Tax=Pisolithus microcarpus 441 TaxID=765257 RepID=A0A0D0A0G0_9AGAM|nr:hypothetical protein PISMIDRAFT_92103 [Pisolithus microcarpus 441]
MKILPPSYRATECLVNRISLQGRRRLAPVRTLASQAVCVRFLSTVTPSGTRKLADDKVPPPGTTAPRKPRIDLKPGPVKPVTLGTDHSPSHPLSKPTPRSSHYHPPRHLHPPKPFRIELSAVELAKRDIAEASQQGVLEAPPADAGSFKRVFHQALQLLKFYFRGLKAINTHRKQVNAIRKRVESGGALPTRAEVRFIQTFKRDAFKLVPFMVVVLIAEELVPFVALYFPRMLPSTCVLPGQRDRIAFKARADQLGALYRNRGAYEAMYKDGECAGFIQMHGLKDPVAVCSLLGLSAWGPSLLAAWRIRRHLKIVAEDDDLLRGEGYGRDLTIRELNEVLSERGMIPTPERRSADDLRDQLRWWLDNTEVVPQGADSVSRRLLLIGLIGSQK